MKFYVVTEPANIRGIYDSWPVCEMAVSGTPGAKYQSVPSRREAEALLRGQDSKPPPGVRAGQGSKLQSGVYAFVDGNHLGGVGIVFVKQKRSGPPVVKEISTTVDRVFAEAGLPTLQSPEAIYSELKRVRNVLAELAGLYKALDHISPNTHLTIVYDYEGVGAWLKKRWKARDPLVAEIVEACERLIREKSLKVRFRHQRGHQSSDGGQNEFAFYNGLADSLATRGAKSGGF